MKKFHGLSALVAVLMLVACADSDDSLGKSGQPSVEEIGTDGHPTIGFDAYLKRGVTRAGQLDVLDLTSLRKSKDAGGGFGVFAYYTNQKNYDQTYIPNFMYNQGVFDSNAGISDAKWDYSPVKYWPNEFGSDAQSDDEDKLTFFAYAPFVESKSAATGTVMGDDELGITGFSGNAAAGDPLVKYVASLDPAKCVDLCWGVCGEASWNIRQGDGPQPMTAGLPWLDVEHPQTVGQRTKFQFQHALAQLNVQIDADVDINTGSQSDDNTDNPPVHSATKIYVRSISFEGIAEKGALNLNNKDTNKPLWLDYSGKDDLSYTERVTIKDGRVDGREGSASGDAPNEQLAHLNPAIVQYDALETTGVTRKLQNLFKPSVAYADPAAPTADELEKALSQPVYVIPTGKPMTVSIVYDVETTNPDLPGYISDGSTHGISVENRITKPISLTLENGKKYTLKLHLGMNSVKFEANIDDWDEKTDYSVTKVIVISYSGETSFESNGSDQKGPGSGDFTATDGDDSQTLAEGTHYKIIYSGLLSDGSAWGPSEEKPIYPGNYNMTLVGMNAYQGSSCSQKFTITARGLKLTGVTAIMKSSDLAGIGAVDAATDAPLTAEDDYQIFYEGTGSTKYGPTPSKPSVPGTYKCTAKGEAESAYGGQEDSETFLLKPEKLYASMRSGAAKPTYVSDGTTPKGPGSGDINIKDENGNTLAMSEGIDYDITYQGQLSDGTSWGPSSEKPVYPGNYELTITGKAGTPYEGLSTEQPLTFKVVGEEIVVTGITNGATLTPEDLDKIAVTGATSGTTLSEPDDYTITYRGVGSTSYGPVSTKPTAAGTYEVDITPVIESKYGDAKAQTFKFTLAPYKGQLGDWEDGGKTSPLHKN